MQLSDMRGYEMQPRRGRGGGGFILSVRESTAKCDTENCGHTPKVELRKLSFNLISGKGHDTLLNNQQYEDCNKRWKPCSNYNQSDNSLFGISETRR
jgi:hypothetical protein